MKDFIQTLLDIISNSPSSVLFIIIGIVFATSMIINVKNKNKSKKLITVLGWLFVIFFIIIRYNSYLNQLFDNLINSIFIQIFFPNLATYIIIILTVIFSYVSPICRKNGTSISQFPETTMRLRQPVRPFYTIYIM